MDATPTPAAGCCNSCRNASPLAAKAYETPEATTGSYHYFALPKAHFPEEDPCAGLETLDLSRMLRTESFEKKPSAEHYNSKWLHDLHMKGTSAVSSGKDPKLDQVFVIVQPCRLLALQQVTRYTNPIPGPGYRLFVHSSSRPVDRCLASQCQFRRTSEPCLEFCDIDLLLGSDYRALAVVISGVIETVRRAEPAETEASLQRIGEAGCEWDAYNRVSGWESSRRCTTLQLPPRW